MKINNLHYVTVIIMLAIAGMVYLHMKEGNISNPLQGAPYVGTSSFILTPDLAPDGVMPYQHMMEPSAHSVQNAVNR